MNADELAALVGAEAAKEMASALSRIKHCLNQLTDEQIWWRPQESMNSIGNLVLHLAGNVRQWIVSGIGGARDVRNRPAEFSERGPFAKAELTKKLDEVVHGAKSILERLKSQQLLAVRRIQGSDMTALAAIWNSVPHFRGHTQEIVHMTRMLLGSAYQFAWAPTTLEEGAPV